MSQGVVFEVLEAQSRPDGSLSHLAANKDVELPATSPEPCPLCLPARRHVSCHDDNRLTL